MKKQLGNRNFEHFSFCETEAQKCEVCGSTEVRQVYRLEISDIFQCADCEFTFAYPINGFLRSYSSGKMTIKADEEYFRPMAVESGKRKKQYNRLANRRFKYYASLLGKNDFTILEIGCGVAGLSHQFTYCGAKYDGIDIDPYIIKYARRNGARRVREIDFFNLGDDEQYDLICASQVLEHIKYPVKFIKKIHHHLNKHGCLHIDVPNQGSLACVINNRLGFDKNRYGAIKWPRHLISFSHKTLKTLLSKYYSVMDIFSANTNDKTWGLVLSPSLINKLFLQLSAICRRHSLLVAIGRKI